MNQTMKIKIMIDKVKRMMMMMMINYFTKWMMTNMVITRLKQKWKTVLNGFMKGYTGGLYFIESIRTKTI